MRLPKLPHVAGRKAVAALGRAGWVVDRMHSGHVMLVNPSHPGVTIAVSVHAGETVATGTLRRIIRDAGLSVEEFCRLLGG